MKKTISKKKYADIRLSKQTKRMLAGMVTIGALAVTNKTANADSSQGDISQKTESAKSTVPENSGIKVVVDHTDLDKTVSEAQKNGVEIHQDISSETQTVEPDKAQEVHDQFVNDYANQQKQIESVTAKQVEKNESFSEKTSDAKTTNQLNEQKINSAVEAAQTSGISVNHDSQNDKVVDATIDNYDSIKESVNADNQKTADILNQATAEFNANKTVEAATNDFTALNTAVKNAQDTLGENNVRQTATINLGKVTVDNAKDLSNKIKADYDKQVSALNATTKQYKDAVNAAGAINKSELEQAVKNAQAILGNDSVKQGATIEKTTTVDNTASTVAEVNREYKNQADDINQKIDAYKSEYDKYQKELDAYCATLNKDQIDSNAIIQSLLLKSEPNAQVTFDNKSNLTYKGKTDNYHTFELVSGNDISGTVSVTYDNLENSFYGNKKIKKIVAVFSNANTDFQKISNRDTASLNIIQDPTLGFWYNGIEGIDVDYTFYDVDGNLIDFSNDKLTGAGAWITLGSLNSGSGRIEKVKLLSTGKAYGFKNSSVSIHSGNELYSEKTNSMALKQGEDPLASNTNWIDREATDFPWGNEEWDAGLENEHAYYGAGVLNVTGKDIKLRFSTTRNYNLEGVNSGTWATISTTIVKDDSGIKTPEKPTVNYHFNSVTIEKPVVEYHYNNSESIPFDRNITYSYSKLNVKKPDAEKANYKYHAYKVAGTSSKNASQVSDGIEKNVNDKTVTKGDTVTYNIETSPLPADRIDNQLNYKVVDKLPNGERYKDFIAEDGSGKDITSEFTVNYNHSTNTVIIETKKDSNIVDSMNADKGQQFMMPKIKISTIVTEDGAKLENTAETYLNDVKTSSNTIVNNVSKPNPEKKQFINGKEFNEKVVLANDVIEYKIDWDLSTLNNFTLSDDQLRKGMSLFDDYDPHTIAIKDSITVTDESGQGVPDLSFDWDDKNTSLLVSVNDVKAFLNKYVGQKLKVGFNAKVTTGFEGDIKNQAAQNDFGNSYKTNVVTAKVALPSPKKDIVATVGDSKSINEADVVLGEYVSYKLQSKVLPANRVTNVETWKQRDVIDTTHDSVTGLWNTFLDQDLIDSDGSIIGAGTDISDFVTFVYKDGVVEVSPKDSFKALLNSDANKEHEISYTTYFSVKRIAPGFVYNVFDDVLNEVSDESNRVWTFTYNPIKPSPHKKVTVGKTEDVSAADDNNTRALKGETLSFTLSGDDLPEYHEDVKSLQIDETFDSSLAYAGYKAFIKNESGSYIDVTDKLLEKIEGQNVTWRAKDELIDLLSSGDRNKNKASLPFVIAYAKVIKDNVNISNEYKLTVNDKYVVSNKTNTPIPGVDPVKQVLNRAGEDIDNTNVMAGDLLDYRLTWDLSQLESIKISDDLINMEHSMNDDYDESKIDVDKSSLTIKNSSNEDVTSLFNVQWDDSNGSFKVTFKAGNRAFLDTYKGQKLFVDFIGKPKVGLDDGSKITNVAKQITAGNEYFTQVVTNYVYTPKPAKDIVDSVGSQTSLNGAKIKLGDVKKYKLTSSIRPANYKEKTEQWKFVDILDPKDEYTGVTEVYSKTDMYDSQGKLIPAGTNITKYFTENFNEKTNTVTLEITDEFKTMLDEHNQNNEVQFDIFVEVKRIGTGIVKNLFVECFNNAETQSNVVKTFTEEPKEEVPEIPNIPEEKTPETPIENEPNTPPEEIIYKSADKEVIVPSVDSQNTPEQVLPQMGDDNNDHIVSVLGSILSILSLGMLGFLVRKKRVEG